MSTPLTSGPAKKSLGQHFLFDPSILTRVATAGGPVQGRTVIEVGPGPGGLTRALLDSGAGKLLAVELDDRFAAGLSLWAEARPQNGEPPRLHIHHGDALAANLPPTDQQAERDAVNAELVAMIDDREERAARTAASQCARLNGIWQKLCWVG
jgi:16S rRNA A1518/A1519 N6-dimethyltransferase RsmA/KsgA/DIM1 with predicted DNA glycosylase/AP lyase activity